MEQHGLELASKRVQVVEEGTRHESAHVTSHVSQGCIKDKAIDRLLAEGAETDKGDHGKGTAQE